MMATLERAAGAGRGGQGLLPESAGRLAAERQRRELQRQGVEAGRPTSTWRATRLFSLEQRARLHGTHGRRTGPVAGRAYVAGVAWPRGSTPGASGPTATVTIGEMDLRAPSPVLWIVSHVPVAVDAPDAAGSRLLRHLGEAWRCRRLAEGAAKGAMGVALLRAVNAGRVKVYAQDGSAECREFWAQMVRAQSRVGPDGGFDFSVPGGGDGYLMGLALAVEAARGLLAPSQGSLGELLCA